ncbi:hypothetical protein M1146_04010 [Patescibacteria group bacterium]|nr:hypothetical protein [Patescibacteria group bacterium]
MIKAEPEEKNEEDQQKDQEPGKVQDQDEEGSWSPPFLFFFFAIFGGCIFYNYFVKK